MVNVSILSVKILDLSIKITILLSDSIETVLSSDGKSVARITILIL